MCKIYLAKLGLKAYVSGFTPYDHEGDAPAPQKS